MKVTARVLILLLSAGTAGAFLTSSVGIRLATLRSPTSASSSNIFVGRAAPARKSHLNHGALSLRGAASKAVVPLQSEQEFDLALGEKKLVFVELYGSHCRKCFAVMGKFSHLAEQHAKPDTVAFAQIACDKATDVAQRIGVSKVPTFQVYLEGKKVDELVGKDSVPIVSKKIKELVQQWVAVASSSSATEAEQTAAAQQVIDEYNAADVQLATSAVDAGECGPDGCEINWD